MWGWAGVGLGGGGWGGGWGAGVGLGGAGWGGWAGRGWAPILQNGSHPNNPTLAIAHQIQPIKSSPPPSPPLAASIAEVQAQTPLAELLGASGQAEALPAALRQAKLCHLQDLRLGLHEPRRVGRLGRGGSRGAAPPGGFGAGRRAAHWSVIFWVFLLAPPS